jgi:uncharacterized iron-regulated membrane protein
MHFVRHWHARLGVLAATFFLLLAVSGLALNHTDALGLVKREVNASWLMQWYGLKPSVPTRGYLFKNGYLAATEGRWVMDGYVLQSTGNKAPLGAVSWGDVRVIASEDSLYLYLPDGQLVDKVSGADLPNRPIMRLGVIGRGVIDASVMPKLVLSTAQGNYVSDDGLIWQALTDNQPVWSSEQTLPSKLSASLNMAFSPSLPLERIILDMHSGRIFGQYGPLLMDVMAVGLIALSLSGVWIYLRTVRRKTRH